MLEMPRFFEDYRRVVEMVLEDGIISPSEDQLLWSLRQDRHR